MRYLSLQAALMAGIVHGSIGQGYAQDAANQDVCRDIIAYASRDISKESISASTARAIYSEHCEGSTSRKSSQTNVGLDTVIKAIPTSFKLGTGSSNEKMNNFCKIYSDSGSSDIEYRGDSSVVVREALAAFNQCVALANKGVYFVPSIHKTQVAVDVRRGSAEDVQIQGVRYKPELLDCNVPSTDDNASTSRADITTRKKLSGGSYPISCDRKAIVKDDGGSEYPYVDLSIITDRGTFVLPIREEELRPRRWASEIEMTMSELKADLGKLSQEMQDRQKKSEGNIASLQEIVRRASATCNALGFSSKGGKDVNGRRVYVRFVASIFDGSMDDGGPRGRGDGLEVYCVQEDGDSALGSIAVCLSKEACPWR